MMKGGLKMSKNVKESVEKIREECDNIESEEEKKGKTRGDPTVTLY